MLNRNQIMKDVKETGLKPYIDKVQADAESVTEAQKHIAAGLCDAYLSMVEKAGCPASTIFICTVAMIQQKMNFTETEALLYTSLALDVAKGNPHGKI